MTTTLLELRTRAQSESDNLNQLFVSNAEWLYYINSSAQELYGLVVQAYGNDYFTQNPASGYVFTTDGINDHFALPADLFKLLGVDLQISSPSQWVTLRRFNFNDRNRLNVVNSLTPQAGQVIRLLYVPRFTPFVLDADTMDGVNGWEEYIVVDAAMKALAKEESDVSVLMARKQALIQRLEAETENRDAGMPMTVGDTNGRRARGIMYRLNGPSIWLQGNGQPGWGPYGDWSTDAEGWGFW